MAKKVHKLHKYTTGVTGVINPSYNWWRGPYLCQQLGKLGIWISTLPSHPTSQHFILKKLIQRRNGSKVMFLCKDVLKTSWTLSIRISPTKNQTNIACGLGCPLRWLNSYVHADICSGSDHGIYCSGEFLNTKGALHNLFTRSGAKQECGHIVVKW